MEMIDPVSPISPLASLSSNTPDRQGRDDKGGSATPAAASAPAAAPPPDSAAQPLRLVVEPTAGGDSYTYKLFDRATGALVVELPQEQAAKLSRNPDYAAGQVIDAKA
jgi:hypothetical protein